MSEGGRHRERQRQRNRERETERERERDRETERAEKISYIQFLRCLELIVKFSPHITFCTINIITGQG